MDSSRDQQPLSFRPSHQLVHRRLTQSHNNAAQINISRSFSQTHEASSQGLHVGQNIQEQYIEGVDQLARAQIWPNRSQSIIGNSFTGQANLRRTQIRLPPIQNIGRRTNVTQVDQILSELEAKTERSKLPSLITTENEHKSSQDIFKEKDLTNQNRNLNIGQLNLNSTNNEDQDDPIETDRILIQQIIYQNYIPSYCQIQNSNEISGENNLVAPQNSLVSDSFNNSPPLELNHALRTTTNELSQKDDVDDEGQSSAIDSIKEENIGTSPAMTTTHNVSHHNHLPRINLFEIGRRQQNRSNSLILNGSQISFRAPTMNNQPSSTTQLAFSSLVSQQNQNLQRQQEQMTSVPNFGELGRQSLNAERQNEIQDTNVEEDHINQVRQNQRLNEQTQERQPQLSVYDEVRPQELGLRFIRSRTPIRVNRQNISRQQQDQQNNQQTNAADNEVIRSSRFQDQGTQHQQQINDGSASSSGSNSDRSRVRSLDINYNPFFAGTPTGHNMSNIPFSNGMQRQNDQNNRSVFDSTQNIQQRTLNRYQSYTGLRSGAHQQNPINLNRRQRPQFINSRQVRRHFNNFVNHFERVPSQVQRQDNSASIELRIHPGRNDTHINHEDLNFGDIDILEDELRRSSNNNANGILLHNFNQLDSSIQNFGSSQQDGLTHSRQGELNEQNESETLQSRNMTLSRMLHFYRNRRSLNQHRVIRSGASDNGADHFVPRTLTQNFMNNEQGGSGGLGIADNSFGILSRSVLRSQTINRRSENFRQNQTITGINDNIVNIPSNVPNLRNNDTHTIQENIEHLDLLDAQSNNQNENAGGARYTPQENRIQRRPMSRAAGFDSRPQQSQNVINHSTSQNQNNFLGTQLFQSPNTSENHTHNGPAVMTLFPRTGGTNIQSLEQLRASPIDMSADQTQQQNQQLQNSQIIQDNFEGQQLSPEQQQRQNRRARYLQIFRTRIPTFDDNFMSRSETQIQNQLYQRGVGLPPRLSRQNGTNMLNNGQGGLVGTHYQSIGNLPTLNEVNELNLFRNYRSNERLYDVSGRPFPEDNADQIDNIDRQIRVERVDENNFQNPLVNRPSVQVQSSSDDTQQNQGTDSVSYRYIQSNTVSQDGISSSNVPVDDRPGLIGSQWRNRESNVRTRISPDVRRRRQLLNRRSNDDSYIGRGTRYLRTFNQMRSQALRQTQQNLGDNNDRIIDNSSDEEAPEPRQGIRFNPNINYMNQQNNQAAELDSSNDGSQYLNSPMFQDKRSKLKLVKIYNKLKPHIPKEWRIEELCRDTVTKQDFCVTYLESYGPLAVLIYLRSQNLVKLERKQQDSLNLETGFEEFVYASMNELGYCNYGRNHDYIKFLVKILQFFQGNLELATDYRSQEAYTKLQKFLSQIVPSCKELRKILKQKRKNKDKKFINKKSIINDEFSIYEENIIYIVTLLIMESFYLQFDSQASCKVKSAHRVKKVVSKYEKEFLPLAIEFYTYHVQSSDLVLLNSLLSFNNFGPTRDNKSSAQNFNILRQNNFKDDMNDSIYQANYKARNSNMLILDYFPNLKNRYANFFQEGQFDLQHYDVQNRIDYYQYEIIRLKNSEQMEEKANFFESNCKDISKGLYSASTKTIDMHIKAINRARPAHKMNTMTLDLADMVEGDIINN